MYLALDVLLNQRQLPLFFPVRLRRPLRLLNLFVGMKRRSLLLSSHARSFRVRSARHCVLFATLPVIIRSGAASFQMTLP